MAPTYEERFIPRIKTKGLDCEGAASCTALTTGAGSLTAPAIVCPTDADTGLYWDGKNLRYAADGAQTAAFTTAGLYGATLTTAAGSASAPAIVCPTDADTGLYWDGKNLQFGVDGSLRAFWSGNGPNAIRYGAQSGMRGYRANGTDASPTATADTNILFDFSAYGHTGADFAPAGVVRFTQDGAISGANCPGSVSIIGRDSSGNAQTGITVRASGTTEINRSFAHKGSTLGFYNTTPATKPTITGSRGGNAALADLLTKLAGLGLLTDSTS